MPVAGQLFFMYATMLIAVPTGVKVFNWIATMWKGSMTFETPMLFAVGFIFVFTMGGFTGVDAGDRAGRHPGAGHLLRGGALPLRAGGRVAVRHVRAASTTGCRSGPGTCTTRRWASWHFWLSLIFFNMTFFPQHFLGLAGMPRRIPDYALQFADFNMIASIGAFGFGLTQLLFLYIVHQVHSRRREGTGASLGRRQGAGVDAAVAAAVPHLRDAAGGRMRPCKLTFA